MSGKIYHVAQFGTYDLKSLGDTMFPTIFMLEMKERFKDNIVIDLYSPSGTDHPYNSLPIVYGLDQLESNHRNNPYDLMVIGGGEFVHFVPVEYISVDGEKKNYGSGELWKEPQYMAEKLGIPVIWNCLGISYDIKDMYQQDMLFRCLKSLKYISVRDVYSKKRLEKVFDNTDINVVGDMLWLFNKHFSKELLDSKYAELSNSYDFLNKKYLVLQYGTSFDYEKIAEAVYKAAKENDLEPVLLVVNYCHEDLEIVNKIKDLYGFSYIDKELSPLEIMSIIQHSELFIGTSLHGNLTAMSYGVKNICLDMYSKSVSKMDGIFNMLEESGRIINDSELLNKKINDSLAEDKTQNDLTDKITKIQKNLEKHFDSIQKMLTKSKWNNYESIKKKLVNVTFAKITVIKQGTETILPVEIDNNSVSFTVSDIKEGEEFNCKIVIDSIYSIESIDAKANNWQLEHQCKNGFVNGNTHYFDTCASISFKNSIYEGELSDVTVNISLSFSDASVHEFYRLKSLSLEKEVEQLNISLNHAHGHVDYMIQKEREQNNLIEEKNNNIQRLEDDLEELAELKNAEIEQKEAEIRKTIEEKNQEIDDIKKTKTLEINKILEEKNAEIGQKDVEICQKDAEICQKNAEIAEKDVTINNQKGHIDQLLITDRYYHQIVNSIGWRIVSFPGKVFEALFPQGSNRRQAIRMYIQGFTTYTTKKVLEYDRIDFKKFDNPDVSIVIPVYNQFEYTYNCLKSIKQNSGDVKYEIIIADDVSYDLTRRISKILSNVKVVRNRKNLRFLLNCNNAAKYANGKYILFLNNDTTVNENWLEPLVRLIESDDKIGMVGSKLLYPDGKLQEAGGIVWKDASAWNYGHCQDPESPEFNYVREVDYISGAAIMIKKSLWEEIGGFDEQLVPAYYEDTDLAFEVRKHGYKVMYQPQSEVVHFEGVSNGTDVSTGLKQYQVVNRDKFYEKWKKELAKHKDNAQDVFIAKDRSIYKKHILVVDHYVPHHDKDAGGKCTFMYLQLFVKLGMQVTFIGDNFYKHEPYTTELNQMGIEVLYGNYYYNNWQEWLKENAHYFDYIYLQRPHISVKYIDLVKEASDAKIFYFAHDLHHIREMREYELTGDEEKLKASEHWKEIEYDLFSKTDVGHVVGSYEQEIMQKAFPKKAIRNIPLYMYESFPENLQKDFSKRNDLLYVGGFGHPPNVDCVLWFAKEVYPKILEKYPDMVWHVVGGSVPDEIKELNSSNIIIEGFVDDAKLEELYRSCRISIVPLRFGAGVKGKVIEAAYYQIPLVTTSIGAEGLSREEPYMIIEDDPDKYADIVCSLYEDYDKLKQMSDEGKRFIENHFTVKAAENVIRMDMDI